MSRKTMILTLAEGLLAYDVGDLTPEEYAAFHAVFDRARRLRHYGPPGVYLEVDETMKVAWSVSVVPSDCVKPVPGTDDVTRAVELHGAEVEDDLRERFAKLRRTVDPRDLAEAVGDGPATRSKPDESLDRGDIGEDEIWGVIPDCTCGVSEKILEDGAGQRDDPDIHFSQCAYRIASEVSE